MEKIEIKQWWDYLPEYCFDKVDGFETGFHGFIVSYRNKPKEIYYGFLYDVCKELYYNNPDWKEIYLIEKSDFQ